MKSFDTYLEALEDAIADLQAQLDEAELFGGETCILKDSLAEFRRERDAERSKQAITLERGETIQHSPVGAWGRIHFMLYALGAKDADEDHKYWVCTLCGKHIKDHEPHYKRTYYLNHADNRTGRQARICEACKETHETNFPTMTTFSVFRPARRKAA